MESDIGERILNVMKQYNFDILQRNGQRISSVANWTDPVPLTDCEVFVGKIPKNCFEDELLPVMQMAGPVYEMRLMMDFSGQNRGYGFVKYTRLEYMESATILLNEYEIRPNQKLAVVKANNNCKLLLTGLPITISISNLKEELGWRTEGLIAATTRPGTDGGLALCLEYRDHLSAAVARKRLQPEYVRRWGRRVRVAWPQELSPGEAAHVGRSEPGTVAGRPRSIVKSSAASVEEVTDVPRHQPLRSADMWARCVPPPPLHEMLWQLSLSPCGLQPAPSVSAAAWAAYVAALAAYSLGHCEGGCRARAPCRGAESPAPADTTPFNRAPGSALHKPCSEHAEPRTYM